MHSCVMTALPPKVCGNSMACCQVAYSLHAIKKKKND